MPRTRKGWIVELRFARAKDGGIVWETIPSLTFYTNEPQTAIRRAFADSRPTWKWFKVLEWAISCTPVAGEVDSPTQEATLWQRATQPH